MPEDLTEAFLWSEYRTVTKTATVSLHGNSYQVEPALAGRKIELVFSPFDMETIEVRYQHNSYGTALPHNITRHVHPKARPETSDHTPPPATGIDYLQLTADAHDAHIRGEQRIGYDALYATDAQTTPPPAPATVSDDGQIPGQLSIDDITHPSAESRTA